ncbi:MAG: hypothetical protein IK126_08140 [Bacteroidales bacterium]|nr:hypothetical protein [Bacteroidales bacterium]
MEKPRKDRNVDVMHNGMLICHEQTIPNRGGENSRPNDRFGIIAALL